MVEKKKVLIIAYHFPPDAAVGAMRPQKFVKYLPEFGWQPYVLTIKEKHIEKRDEERLGDVRGISITRTSFWRTPLQTLLDIRDRIRKNNVGRTKVNGSASAFSTTSQKVESFGARIKRYFAALNWFPDDKLYWSLSAVLVGYRLIRREKIRFIYATSPPHSVSIIGLVLSKLTGAKLVVDFRDPWVTPVQSLPASVRCSFTDHLNAFFEAAVVNNAYVVITTTERLCNSLKDRYQNSASATFATIPNGYDACDFKDAGRQEGKTKFIISYLGTFYMERDPENFLIALRQAISRGDIPPDRVEVRFIGKVNEVSNKPIGKILDKHGITSLVKVLGRVSHSEAIRQMQSADLLLLLAPNQGYQIPAKTFEYMGARRPILAITEDGATADVIKATNAGLVAHQDDVDGIQAALKCFYDTYTNADCWYQGVDIKTFERKRLTQQFTELLV